MMAFLMEFTHRGGFGVRRGGLSRAEGIRMTMNIMR